MQSCNPLYQETLWTSECLRALLDAQNDSMSGHWRVQWVQKGSRPGNVSLGDYILFFLIMCVVLVRFTRLFTCLLKCSKELSITSFLFLETAKELERKHEDFACHCYALAQGGCSSCENFRVSFVQDSLAGRETKWIKEKSQTVVCMELLLLIFVGCGSACATIEADSKAWMAWVAKDLKQE